MAAPDSGRRTIRRVEYSTDGGMTWARLCYRWIPDAHVVQTGSDGTAFVQGQALPDVRLRYVTTLGDLVEGAGKTITLA